MDQHDDYTIPLTDFVNTLFEPSEGEAVCMVRIPTDEEKAAGRFTEQHRFNPLLMDTDPGRWYVCLSTVRDPGPRAQRLKRRKQDCTAAWVLFLDDIGTKIDPINLDDMLPSVILESSAGNYQYLYILESPIEDMDYFEACVRSLGEAGYTDKGAGGCARVFRLPGSLNPGKGNFVTRITRWAPQLRFELEEIMEFLALEPLYERQHQGAVYESAVPDEIDDPVLDWLEDNGRLGRDNGDFYTVRCPNAHNHTDGNPDAGYSPLGHGLHPLFRTFNCFHEHCTELNGETFLQWVAEQNGPRVGVSGVSEVTQQQLEHNLEALTEAERYDLAWHSLPEVRREDLPRQDLTRNGLAKAQPTTAQNVKRVCDLINLEPRMNMQTHQIECTLLDDNLASLVPDRTAVRRLLLDKCIDAGMANGAAIDEVLDVLALNHRYSPVLNWIRSADWDGEDRLTALTATVKVPRAFDQVWPIYLRRWLLQTVQAICNWQGEPKPIEHVLVLAGPQGTYKTTWIKSLLPDAWVTTGIYLNLGNTMGGDRDTVRLATGTPITELGELETTFKRTEVGHQKNFLSQREDRYRPAYGRTELTFPRTTSFAATVNTIDFLIDPTGSRRFWPVEVLGCDSRHGIDLQQLWAQVWAIWQKGEAIYLTEFEEQLRNRHAEHFTFVSPVEEIVREYLSTHRGGEQPMNATRVCSHLNIHTSNANKKDITRTLEISLGPHRTLDKVQRAWMIPTVFVGGHLKLVSDGDKKEGE